MEKTFLPHRLNGHEERERDTEDRHNMAFVYIWASQVGQVVKNLPASAGDVSLVPWVRKIP